MAKYTATVLLKDAEVAEIVPVRAGIKGYVRELVKAGIFDDLTWYPSAAIVSVTFNEIEEEAQPAGEAPDYGLDFSAKLDDPRLPEQDGEGM